jgi:hypothetical protein
MQPPGTYETIPEAMRENPVARTSGLLTLKE